MAGIASVFFLAEESFTASSAPGFLSQGIGSGGWLVVEDEVVDLT